jgi:hypothetical protein
VIKSTVRIRAWVASFSILLFAIAGFAQAAPQPPVTPETSENYSGMYSFRQDGEFVQISVEDAGRVTGFISRYGDGETDKGAFLNQFFKQGSLDGRNLSFTTDTVHGEWFQFKGTADGGPGATPSDEAYHILKGTLTEYRVDADKKVSPKSTDWVFKSFPQDVEAAPRR